jgi:hypothetical protein
MAIGVCGVGQARGHCPYGIWAIGIWLEMQNIGVGAVPPCLPLHRRHTPIAKRFRNGIAHPRKVRTHLEGYLMASL